MKNLSKAMEITNDLMSQALGLRGVLDLANLSETEDGMETYENAVAAALSDMEGRIAELKKLVVE